MNERSLASVGVASALVPAMLVAPGRAAGQTTPQVAMTALNGGPASN